VWHVGRGELAGDDPAGGLRRDASRLRRRLDVRAAGQAPGAATGSQQYARADTEAHRVPSRKRHRGTPNPPPHMTAGQLIVGTMTLHLGEVRDRIAAGIVGRRRELDLVLAAVAAGRDIVLEGPPGTSKSTLVRAITQQWGIPLLFVEGNADLTPAKIVGYHSPSRVLRSDYSADTFVEGPLVEAMRTGGFLYVEELNRAPEDTLNTLLTAMAERQIALPRVGTVVAAPTFRIIASMNPYDNVGTTRLSASIHDRFCRLSVDYQDDEAERGIVRLRARLTGLDPELRARLIADAVAVTRATRGHHDIRQGSSVRGAIDLALVGERLLELTGSDDYAETVYSAMTIALSGRIHLDDVADTTPERVLRAIWEDHFVLNPAIAEPG
jgi:MoxR-like ATPase